MSKKQKIVKKIRDSAMESFCASTFIPQQTCKIPDDMEFKQYLKIMWKGIKYG